MTNRSDRDKILDKVIEHLDYLDDLTEDEEPELCHFTKNIIIYRARKGVYLLMDNPGENLD